tara:strand:- start:375 stop:758 length:384 start_codon:yes stop_codon:yes gene_type:complete
MSIKNQKYQKNLNDQLLGTEDPKIIIYELLNGLNNKLGDTLLCIEKGKNDDAKKNALKAQNIAFALRKALDHKDGGDVAKNLDYLYAHIHVATDKFIKNDSDKLLNSALLVSSEIFSGWKGLVNKIA